MIVVTGTGAVTSVVSVMTPPSAVGAARTMVERKVLVEYCTDDEVTTTVTGATTVVRCWLEDDDEEVVEELLTWFVVS